MEQKNIIIICITVILCVAILSTTAIIITGHNNKHENNDTVNITLNNTNQTNNTTTQSTQKTTKKPKTKKQATFTDEELQTAYLDEDGWIYGENPNVDGGWWKKNKQTGEKIYGVGE